jgi:hypothetical protein
MDPESAMLQIAAHAFTVRHARYRQGGSEDRPGDLGRLRVVTMARSFDSVNRAETLRGLDRMVAPDGAVAPLDARNATGRSVVSEERRAALIGRRPVEMDA